METWDAIRSRRNVRSYEDRAILEGDLDRILEAGWRSPSSRNEQRWDFVLCTERQQLQRLSRVWRSAGHVATSAATVALIAPVATDAHVRESVHYDLGQATMSMMLAAADLGIGSGHASVADQDLAREVLDLPTDHLCAWLVAFGYPADRPLTPIGRPDRRPFDDVVHRGGW
jgi:nitroreductase